VTFSPGRFGACVVVLRSAPLILGGHLLGVDRDGFWVAGQFEFLEPRRNRIPVRRQLAAQNDGPTKTQKECRDT
jgi:hypothetical protein